ncbi:MAG: amino acid permease [Hyphomicrobiaceae bacterium]|nr:amino acid permease [Hyphomicrobiaceae bacterium]
MKETQQSRAPGPAAPTLARTLSLTYATLYGLGVTIGAGIYVLVGEAAARAGMHAPLAFAAAAVLMALSAASFAELAGRLPVAAGEAAYARQGFRSDLVATIVGLLVVAIAVVSAAAISVGSAGYLAVFIPLPEALLTAGVVLVMGAIAAGGVRQSVGFAAAMTLVEVGGLVLLIVAGFGAGTEIVTRLPEAIPTEMSPAVLAGLMSATLLAVFAFIGFEGLANIAEEVRDPHRALPRAIFLTLAISTLLYVLVVWICLVTVGSAELAQSRAPLVLVFERLTGASPATMTLIAIIATLNGIIVQIILSSRVLYGLARYGDLPSIFGTVHPTTRTPLTATLSSTALILLLALILPLGHLADVTSRLTLVVFAVVNISLVLIKRRERVRPDGIFVAPAWVPCAGAATCIALLAADLIATWIWS